MKEGLFYLAAIIVAEAITVFVGPVWGVISYMVLLVCLILRSALVESVSYRQLFLSLVLIPVLRIINLSLPPVVLSDWWYPTVYVPLLLAAVIAVHIFHMKGTDIGFSLGWLKVQPLIVLSGFLIGVVEYFILKPEPMFAELTWQAAWLPMMVFLLVVGFAEEFIFRGVLQHSALKVWRGWGIIYISLIFATLHIGSRSWADVIFIFVIALFFGWAVKRTRSLLGVTLSHGITNTVLYVVAPLLF